MPPYRPINPQKHHMRQDGEPYPVHRPKSDGNGNEEQQCPHIDHLALLHFVEDCFPFPLIIGAGYMPAACQPPQIKYYYAVPGRSHPQPIGHTSIEVHRQKHHRAAVPALSVLHIRAYHHYICIVVLMMKQPQTTKMRRPVS